MTRDRWMPIREVAERHGKSPKTLRAIAEEQNGIARKTRSNRTLIRWPKFQRDGSGRWGVFESQYTRHFAEVSL
jgi:hypothetical protein